MPPPPPPPPQKPLPPTPVDEHTLAVLRATSGTAGLALRDARGSPVAGVLTATTGGPTLNSSNLRWMVRPSGFAVATKDANDTVTYVLPAAGFSRLAANATLSLSIKLFVSGSGQGQGEPIGWGHLQPGNPFGGNVLAGLLQDWQRFFGWSCGEWDRPARGEGPAINLHSPQIPSHGKATTILSPADLQKAMPMNVWNQLELALTPTTSAVFVNSKLVAHSDFSGFFDGTIPLNLTIGGFQGAFDDVMLSDAVRSPGLPFKTDHANVAAASSLKSDDGSAAHAYPLTSLMDGRALLKARNAAKNGTAPAYAALVAELTALADRQLTTGPFSVTNGTFLPPTGDMHDYLSVAGYTWPPNTTCNASLLKQMGVASCDRWCGEPSWDPTWENSTTRDCNWTLAALKYPGEPTGDRWYPHSGYNGELWSRVDRVELEGLEAAVFPLAMAWWYTSRSEYLERVVHLLRVWFLDPATRMNPRLDYGAHIPGAFDGCPSGIVDFGNMPWIFDAIRLVTFDGSPTWTPDDERDFMTWIAEYHQWFNTAPNSKLALKISNDIGTTVIKVGMSTSLFAGDQKAAEFLAANHSAVMLSRLLGPTGAFSHDPAAIGADSFGYAIGDLLDFLESESLLSPARPNACL